MEITVPASGILLRAQETTKDMYSSIDLVIEKIERQIHKYKTRLMKRKYILQMNLLNHDFFVFYDPDFGGVNVVYRRKDGNYGLLAPELK